MFEAPGSAGFDDILLLKSNFGDQRTRASEDFAALRRGMAEDGADSCSPQKSHKTTD
jgi:hypothetical protein